jgi:protein tyrosine/serine phosphatase
MRLYWPDCLNTRDLGGLPTNTGQRVRTGALVRSDLLDQLTDEGAAALRAYGIRRIVDLRTVGEVAVAPGPFAADDIYRHLSFIDEEADREREADAEPTLLDIYRGSLDRNGRSIHAVLDAIAFAPPGGVLVHCHAGKDRTGVLIALVLRALGVPDEEIAADYALTQEYLAERHEVLIAAEPDKAEQERVRDLYGATVETIVGLMAYLDDRYGGTLPYLEHIGVSDTLLAALRDRLLED